MFGHGIWRPAAVAVVMSTAAFLPQGVAVAATPDTIGTVSCSELSVQIRNGSLSCRPLRNDGVDGVFIGPVSPSASPAGGTTTGSASVASGSTTSGSTTTAPTTDATPTKPTTESSSDDNSDDDSASGSGSSSSGSSSSGSSSDGSTDSSSSSSSSDSSATSSTATNSDSGGSSYTTNSGASLGAASCPSSSTGASTAGASTATGSVTAGGSTPSSGTPTTPAATADSSGVASVTSVGNTVNNTAAAVGTVTNNLASTASNTASPVAGTVANAAAAVTGNANLPADLIDLSYWYLTLPTGQAGSPETIENPNLEKFTNDAFKLNNSRDGVVFSARADGVTTKNSHYPRSELREMNGSQKASWSNTTGSHTLDVCEAITKTPTAKPEIVGAQIHDANDDVMQIRLEGKTLMVQYNDGKTETVIDPNYVLGTPYNVRIVAEGGKVDVLYNGQKKAELPLSGSGWYWKVGAYVQSNTEKGESPDSTGEVTVYSLKCVHT
jgi:hypothetical protein